MIIGYGMGIALFTFFMVLVVRGILCNKNRRKLTKKEPIADPDMRKHYCRRLAEMIRCETVSVKGEFHPEEFQKLRHVIKTLFPVVSQKAQLQYFGEDCYVYRIPGKDSGKNVMLMSHHDVVPAEGEWKYPAFSGKLKEGCVWGRGTVDTKTPLFAEFSALEELLESGWKPPCNVYLVSSHNEEIGGDGVPLALKYFEEKGLHFEWILDEGGAVIDPPMGGISCKCAMLAVHEKGRYRIRIRATRELGHASLAKQQPSPEVRMANLITRIEKEQPFLRKMHPEVSAMFENLAPYMNFPMRLVFANMWCFRGILVRLIPSLNSSAGSMLGTTCSFQNLCTTKEGDCTAEVFFRCVKGEDLQKDLETFYEIAKEYDIVKDEILMDEYYPPASLESEGYHFIKSCVEKEFPYAACAPFILPAGTDARHFSNLSEAVIRFAPIDINGQQYASVHNQNENIGMDEVVRAVRFYRELLKMM